MACELWLPKHIACGFQCNFLNAIFVVVVMVYDTIEQMKVHGILKPKTLVLLRAKGCDMSQLIHGYMIACG